MNHLIFGIKKKKEKAEIRASTACAIKRNFNKINWKTAPKLIVHGFIEAVHLLNYLTANFNDRPIAGTYFDCDTPL